ncbi:MAG: hypothetical protein MH137_11890 [Flavobacteriales bacterium]|nr:hypothetical protein [Flavobacteriales bacterium]
MRNVFVLVIFLLGLENLSAQNPILRSATTGSPPNMPGVSTSIMTQSSNSNFIGIGTTAPTERLHLRFNSESVFIPGVGFVSSNRMPAIRFDFQSIQGVVNNWRIGGGENFILENLTTPQQIFSAEPNGSIKFNRDLSVNLVPHIAGGNNAIGLKVPDANTRVIYWSSFTSNPSNNNTSVPLEFVFDAIGAGTVDVSVMKLMPSGQVRIGNSNTVYDNFTSGNAANINNTARLVVNGSVVARGFIATQQNWADHVFYNSANNPSLAEEEQSILNNCTLVGVPSEEEAAKGLNLADTDALLLEKIEQLYLHVIELNKKVEKLTIENENLKKLKSNERVKMVVISIFPSIFLSLFSE